MLTVNPLFWAAGIYICLASENRTENLMKKALVVASLAVGISLISDYLFFAVYMGSKDVWHITTFYGYAWLAVLTFGEVLLLKKVVCQTICCDDKAVADINPVFIIATVLPVLLFNVR